MSELLLKVNWYGRKLYSGKGYWSYHYQPKDLYSMYVLNIHMDGKKIQFTPLEIRITTYIFKHYQQKFNARQLARVLEINHAHAQKLCTLLMKKQLLVQERVGNSIYFSYNYNYNLALNFMVYVLSLEEFPPWLTVLKHSLKKFEKHLTLGLVFGSSIKIEAFNDIDVLLVYHQQKKKTIQGIKEEIRRSELLEKPIRYLEVAEQDILRNKNKIMYQILSESFVFRNPEKYVEVVRKCRSKNI